MTTPAPEYRTNYAQRILSHYFRTLGSRNGNAWDSDYEAELSEIVADIQAEPPAEVAKLRQELEDLKTEVAALQSKVYRLDSDMTMESHATRYRAEGKI